MNPFHHLLVPIDFGDATEPALDLALSIARASDAQITLVHAFDASPFISTAPYMPPLDTQPILAALDRDMKSLCAKTKTACPKLDGVVCTGNVYDQILKTAKERGCDLVVIGTHGRRGIAHALLGSVAERVVRLSPIPVLTVRPETSKTGAKPATAA